MAESIEIVRIPQLQELLENTGSLFLPLWKKDEDKTYRILSSLLSGGTDTTPVWKSTITYQQDDIVEWNLKLWKSLIDDNLNNVPAENENWTEVSKSTGGDGINYWAAGVYTKNPTFVLYSKKIFLLDTTVVSMPFESTNFLTEFDEGKWLQMTARNISDIINLSARLENIERAIPSLNVRYLRSSTIQIAGTTYYESTNESNGDPQFDIQTTVTAETLETANQAGAWVGLPLENAIDFPAQNMTINIRARKNGTSKTVYLFALVYNLKPDGTEIQIGQSGIETVSSIGAGYNLFIPVTFFSAEAGDRGLIKLYWYAEGTGTTAVGTLSIEGNTLSRWIFDADISAIGGGHAYYEGETLLPQRTNAFFNASDFDLEDDEANDATKLRLSDAVKDTLNNVLWEPELLPAATTEHPRWDDSGSSEIYGRDKFGFNLKPSGNREPTSGTYVSLGEWIDLWVKNANIGSFAHIRTQYNSSLFQIKTVFSPEAGCSVRLVRPYTSADGEKIDGRILIDAFTDYDGNKYNGVIIGDQVWLTSNLKTTSYSDGTPIPTGYNDVDWSNLTTGAYAVYDYTLVSGIDSEAEMIAAYGLLYNWYAVDDSRGLGDADWHVPTDSEFTAFTDYIIATYPEITSDNIGDYLKSVRQVNSPFEYESDEVIRPKENLVGERRKILEQDIILDVTAGFSFTGIDSFKHVFGKKIEFSSVIKDPGITDLRVGINGNTPTTISFPFTVLASDIVEFAATYDRESDSYFTLIGKNIE